MGVKGLSLVSNRSFKLHGATKASSFVSNIMVWHVCFHCRRNSICRQLLLVASSSSKWFIHTGQCHWLASNDANLAGMIHSRRTSTNTATMPAKSIRQISVNRRRRPIIEQKSTPYRPIDAMTQVVWPRPTGWCVWSHRCRVSNHRCKKPSRKIKNVKKRKKTFRK